MSHEKELDHLRIELDQIDDEIIQLLNKRFLITKEIGEIKINHNLPIFQSERESQIFQRLEHKLETTPFRDEIIKIYESLLAESRKAQSRL